MKKQYILFSLFFVFLITFFVKTDNTYAAVKYPGSSTKVYNGDMLITKKNASGVTSMAGHAGMVVYRNNKAYVIHMPGLGRKIEQMTLSNWSKTYKSIKIVRSNSDKNRNDAATWMKKKYDNKKIRNGTTYKITSNNLGSSPSYCSKLVWQAYYYGAKKDLTAHYSHSLGYYVPTSGIVTPYSLLESLNTKVVYKKW